MTIGTDKKNNKEWQQQKRTFCFTKYNRQNAYNLEEVKYQKLKIFKEEKNYF